MKGLIIMAMCILIVGCEIKTRCQTNSDCNESEYCYCDLSIMNTCTCRESPNYYETTNETTPLNFGYGNDTYCYRDNSKGIHCDCDVIIYEDGHNETKNCYCWNDLAIHYTCINKAEHNITDIKKVKT